MSAAKPPSDYGPVQLGRHLQLKGWQIERAQDRGLIPAPDVGGRRWSAAVVDALVDQVPGIVEVVGEHPGFGAPRSAQRLAEATGLPVVADDVEALVSTGVLAPTGEYEEHDLYDPRDLDRLAAEPAELAAVVADRQAWLAVSLDLRQAADRCGWRPAELETAAAARGITPGRFGRYATADVERLAGDEELAEQVRLDRLLGPDQAAEHLEIRRTDWDYVVAAGWITPAAYTTVPIGPTGRREADVPLYKTADVESLRDLPGVDWEAVRAVRPGAPSPLREYAPRIPSRAETLRQAAARLTDRFGVPITASYSSRRDRWEITWTLTAEAPTSEAVRAAILADRAARPYRHDITLTPTTPKKGDPE